MLNPYLNNYRLKLKGIGEGLTCFGDSPKRVLNTSRKESYKLVTVDVSNLKPLSHLT